jgi:hypothetical protein
MDRIERELAEIRESSTRKFSIFEEDGETEPHNSEANSEEVDAEDELAELALEGDRPADEAKGATHGGDGPANTAMPQSLRQLVAESREAAPNTKERKRVARKGSSLLAKLNNGETDNSPQSAMLEQLAQQRKKYSQERSHKRAAKQRIDKENDMRRRRSRSSSRSSVKSGRVPNEVSLKALVGASCDDHTYDVERVDYNAPTIEFFETLAAAPEVLDGIPLVETLVVIKRGTECSSTWFHRTGESTPRVLSMRGSADKVCPIPAIMAALCPPKKNEPLAEALRQAEIPIAVVKLPHEEDNAVATAPGGIVRRPQPHNRSLALFSRDQLSHSLRSLPETLQQHSRVCYQKFAKSSGTVPWAVRAVWRRGKPGYAWLVEGETPFACAGEGADVNAFLPSITSTITEKTRKDPLPRSEHTPSVRLRKEREQTNRLAAEDEATCPGSVYGPTRPGTLVALMAKRFNDRLSSSSPSQLVELVVDFVQARASKEGQQQQEDAGEDCFEWQMLQVKAFKTIATAEYEQESAKVHSTANTEAINRLETAVDEFDQMVVQSRFAKASLPMGLNHQSPKKTPKKAPKKREPGMKIKASFSSPGEAADVAASPQPVPCPPPGDLYAHQQYLRQEFGEGISRMMSQRRSDASSDASSDVGSASSTQSSSEWLARALAEKDGEMHARQEVQEEMERREAAIGASLAQAGASLAQAGAGAADSSSGNMFLDNLHLFDSTAADLGQFIKSASPVKGYAPQPVMRRTKMDKEQGAPPKVCAASGADLQKERPGSLLFKAGKKVDGDYFFLRFCIETGPKVVRDSDQTPEENESHSLVIFGQSMGKQARRWALSADFLRSRFGSTRPWAGGKSSSSSNLVDPPVQFREAILEWLDKEPGMGDSRLKESDSTPTAGAPTRGPPATAVATRGTNVKSSSPMPSNASAEGTAEKSLVRKLYEDGLRRVHDEGLRAAYASISTPAAMTAAVIEALPLKPSTSVATSVGSPAAKPAPRVKAMLNPHAVSDPCPGAFCNDPHFRLTLKLQRTKKRRAAEASAMAGGSSQHHTHIAEEEDEEGFFGEDDSRKKIFKFFIDSQVEGHCDEGKRRSAHQNYEMAAVCSVCYCAYTTKLKQQARAAEKKKELQAGKKTRLQLKFEAEQKRREERRQMIEVEKKDFAEKKMADDLAAMKKEERRRRKQRKKLTEHREKRQQREREEAEAAEALRLRQELGAGGAGGEGAVVEALAQEAEEARIAEKRRRVALRKKAKARKPRLEREFEKLQAKKKALVEAAKLEMVQKKKRLDEQEERRQKKLAKRMTTQRAAKEREEENRSEGGGKCRKGSKGRRDSKAGYYNNVKLPQIAKQKEEVAATAEVQRKQTALRRRQALLEFYAVHDPSKANKMHVDNILTNYDFGDTVRALHAKFKVLPAGWGKEIEDKQDSESDSYSEDEENEDGGDGGDGDDEDGDHGDDDGEDDDGGDGSDEEEDSYGESFASASGANPASNGDAGDGDDGDDDDDDYDESFASASASKDNGQGADAAADGDGEDSYEDSDSFASDH